VRGLFSTVSGLPSGLRRLIESVALAGAAALLVAGFLAAGSPVPSLARLGVVALLLVLAHVVRIELRIGGDGASFVWSEGAFIVGLTLLPLPWLVLVSAGALLAHQLSARNQPVKALFNVSSLTVSTFVAGALLLPFGAPGANPFAPATVVLLVAAGVVHATLSEGLTACAVGLSQGVSVWQVYKDGLAVRPLTLLGNVGAGFAVIAVAQIDWRLVFGLAPVLWLVHLAYEGRLRATQERQAWQRLAAATRQFNRLDGDSVLNAAVIGAANVFSAEYVELEWRTHGRSRVFRGDRDGNVREVDPATAERPGTLETRALSGGHDAPLGEIRLCFRGPVKLGDRERLGFSAYADAVAAALRNSEVHGRLRDEARAKAYDAAHDALTGLVNRARLAEVADAMLAAPGNAVALAVLDLDHFKEVTDTLGHEVGDRLLAKVADRLAAAAEPDEVLARLGGDEFAILLPAQPNAIAAASYADERTTKLLNALAAPMDVGGAKLTLEATAGLAVSRVHGAAANGSRPSDGADLLRRAHVAMYHAKRTSRRLVHYAAEQDAGSLDRLALTSELRAALCRRGELVLYLQPTFDLATGVPLGAEALIRWQHPRRGLLLPGQFIPAIEQSDVIRPFTLHVLDLALEACAGWSDELAVPVAVNLSARCLLDRDLPGEVARLLYKHKLPADWLVLEITETVMMSELDVVEEVLGALRTLGVQLSVDDFGTGYSSLTFLVRVPVDEVKIDHSFVAAMATSAEAGAIVRTTVELARTLDLRVVGEGVETHEQSRALAQLGCTGAQGNYLCPPMPIDRAVAALWVATRSAGARRRSAPVIPLAQKRGPTVAGPRTSQENPEVEPDPTTEVTG
jgi:diguanylate cyclase (GGDEF)-like protein